ncbi:MAG: hypothetical protein RSC06_14265 [Clostridia bacterium]
MGRPNGCPFSVRNWAIDIMSRASTSASPLWLRIKGLNSLERSNDADTEDGSSADSIFSEPYVTKRSGAITLEGKPVSDAVSGERDAGQAELDYYATLAGCDGDARIRLADPYGRIMILDAIVTSSSIGADDTSETVSWELEQVGEAEDAAYVQATGITVMNGATSAATLSLAVGTTKSLTVAFTPSTSTNQKFSVASADSSRVRVTNVDGLGFDVVGVASTTGAVGIVVKTMNNALTATVAVTITAA